MSIAALIEQRLREDQFTVAISAGRIGTSRRLQAVPAYVIQIIADPRPQHFKGFERVRATTVQIDSWGKTQAEADEAGAAAINALVPPYADGEIRFQRAMISNVRSGPEQERGGPTPRMQPELYRHSADIIFTHNAN